jgi:hypothetical protein
LAAWGVTVALIGGFVYDLIDLRNPWVIAGLAWTAATFLYMVWKLLRNGRNRMTPEEPCVVFLRRELEGKRRGLLRIRLGILLLFPGILSAWWGGGPLLRAKSLGVQSPWLRHSLAGPALLIAITPILAFCWFSFWTQTRKVEREIERLRAA